MLVVFAKNPCPGEVKTRMTPLLNEGQAATLYAAILEDVLRESARACEILGVDGIVALHPASACAAFAARHATRGFRVIAQRGADLSARMCAAAAEGFAAGASKVVLRGSDNPVLGREQISQILEHLDAVDVVISPDLDGGYGAIGLCKPAPGLFAHAMSTTSVLSDTLANAAAMGLTSRTLDACFDLDTPSDLQRLLEQRAGATGRRAARTIAYLESEPIAGLLRATQSID